MSISVKIIADSISEYGARLTTYELRYPRFIHAEFMTHRALSRNASSTRAVPLQKQIDNVIADTAVPLHFGRAERGMQATTELSGDEREAAVQCWIDARDAAVMFATRFGKLDVHKQIAGRILEPFNHITVIASGTEGGWINFFGLRCSKMAMPDIQCVAVMAAREWLVSRPVLRPDRGVDSYHAPYVTEEERYRLEPQDLLKVSTARCARVSYLNHDGTKPNVTKDAELHDRLESSGHWSPFENCGWPAESSRTRSGNFVGWSQYRQSLNRSVHTSFDFGTLDEFGEQGFCV